MKIRACPKCGSNNIDMGNLQDGLPSREFWRYICRDCGFYGNFLEFDSIKDYERFRREFTPVKDEKVSDEYRQEWAFGKVYAGSKSNGTKFLISMGISALFCLYLALSPNPLNEDVFAATMMLGMFWFIFSLIIFSVIVYGGYFYRKIRKK
ncbi:MAG: hypothetical protein NT038_08495 [Euryarchaeota archaeon]|nr:hypothetical protein [Euryarchaeota archaeon]